MHLKKYLKLYTKKLPLNLLQNIRFAKAHVQFHCAFPILHTAFPPPLPFPPPAVGPFPRTFRILLFPPLSSPSALSLSLSPTAATTTRERGPEAAPTTTTAAATTTAATAAATRVVLVRQGGGGGEREGRVFLSLLSLCSFFCFSLQCAIARGGRRRTESWRGVCAKERRETAACRDPQGQRRERGERSSLGERERAPPERLRERGRRVGYVHSTHTHMYVRRERSECRRWQELQQRQRLQAYNGGSYTTVTTQQQQRETITCTTAQTLQNRTQILV